MSLSTGDVLNIEGRIVLPWLKLCIGGKDILNLPEHSHPLDITQINFRLTECDALNKAIENPDDVSCHRSIDVS